MNKPSVLCIMGPTASGKTALALHLHTHLPVDLVSVDSAQVYKGMDIGTAKPDGSVTHRLIDLVEPTEAYSAARFREDALREIGDIIEHGRIPLLVGGTMLYFRALMHGLAEMPAADPEVRAAIDGRAARLGWEVLHAELAAIDPEAGVRIHPNDPQRIQRALEVYELTGQSITSLQRKQAAESPAYEFHKLAVAPSDRAELHRRIERRFREMVDQGLVEEVAALRARGDLDPDSAALRAVGYRQIWAFLDGRWSREEAIQRGIHATRQLAKRQLTWLRREPGLTWLDPTGAAWLDEGFAWAKRCLC